MSNNGDNNPPKLPINCSRCGLRFSVPYPTAESVNVLKFSSITAVHERPVRCPNCRQAFVVGITHAKLDWAAQVIPEEVAVQLEDSRVVQVKEL